jgi:hypothetical protein
MMLYPRIPEETVKKYEALYHSGIIVWHEEGRHGTIQGIKTKAHVNELYSMLVYFLGQKCAWLKKNSDNTFSLEFCHMTKVFPPPKRPWQWCGTTILFKDWQVKEDTNYRILDTFNIGDQVSFGFRNQVYKGILINKRKRATVLVGGQKFYVPALDLRKA